MTDITQLTAELNAMILDERKRRGMTPTLPLGIHFGLAEDRYHADPGLGSTDIRKLARNPPSYWYSSWMNPRRPADDPTPSQIRGTALHRLVYLGEDYFDQHYICGPDQTGMSTGEKAQSTKRANALAAETGRIALKIDDYERVAICAAMILKNPELSHVFHYGEPEVSIIWEQRGVRCKARIDYLKVRGLGDLKSCANPFDLDFPAACRRDIDRYAYHEQASWYMTARAQMAGFVKAGLVHGSDYDPKWLDQVAACEEPGWAFVFYGIEGPPLTWSAVLSPRNPIIGKARASNAHGLDQYLRFLKDFGTEMWVLRERPQELMMEEMPPWFAR
jgi:hypothetical protein